MDELMIMNKENSYTEILEILKYMDKVYVDKIPRKLINFFEENKSKDYNFKYDNTLKLNEQNLNDNTIALLAMLNLNYWCENEKHKAELLKKYNENEIKYQEKIQENYNPDTIFKNKKVQSADPTIEPTAIIEYKEKNLIQKIFEKIKNFFKS